MLKIRLQRVGRKHEPAFRLVLTESKNSTKSGKFLEILGDYDSRRGEKSIFKADRITYWTNQGAQISDTVHNLLIDKKIISGKKKNVLSLKKSEVKNKAEVKIESTKEDDVKEETSTEMNSETEGQINEETSIPEVV